MGISTKLSSAVNSLHATASYSYEWAATTAWPTITKTATVAWAKLSSGSNTAIIYGKYYGGIALTKMQAGTVFAITTVQAHPYITGVALGLIFTFGIAFYLGKKYEQSHGSVETQTQIIATYNAQIAALKVKNQATAEELEAVRAQNQTLTLANKNFITADQSRTRDLAVAAAEIQRLQRLLANTGDKGPLLATLSRSTSNPDLGAAANA